jgi:hypothetical protein
MKEKLRKFKKTFIYKFIKFVLIPSLLLVFWIMASLVFSSKVNFSVLLYPYSKNNIQITSNRNGNGSVLTGKFNANDKNLGLIMFRFYPNSPRVGDMISFKIKQEGDLNWYHTNSYRSDLLSSGQLLPLGFPIITNSNGKSYQFEISSSSNRVTLDNSGFSAGYEFSKGELISNKKEGIGFLVKKTFTSFTNIDFLLSSLIYLMPLVFYLAICFLPSKIKNRLNIKFDVKKLENTYVGVFLLLIFLDIFIIKEFYLLLLIVSILVWLYASWKMKLGSVANFLLAFILILIWVIIIMFRIDTSQAKLGIWTYTFLVIGVISAIIEERLIKKDE